MKNNMTKNYVARFREAFSRGVESIVEAARIYVDALDNGNMTRDDFAAECRGIPPSAWNGLEAVGRGIIDRRLLWGGGRASTYLRRLPLSEQSRALDEGVRLITTGGDSLTVRVEDMTKEQCDLAFAPDHLRSLGEQRAICESPRKAEPVMLASVEAESAYEIRGNKLIINRPLAMTRADVKRLLGMMRG